MLLLHGGLSCTLLCRNIYLFVFQSIYLMHCIIVRRIIDNFVFLNIFLFCKTFLRARASIAIARISYGNSVRSSVRPSVHHDPVPLQYQVR